MILYNRGLKLSFIRGPYFNKKGLAGHIKRKNVSAGHNWRLKVPLYYKKCSFINNLNSFNDVEGRTNTSGGLRVWEPCSKTCCQPYKNILLKMNKFDLNSLIVCYLKLLLQTFFFCYNKNPSTGFLRYFQAKVSFKFLTANIKTGSLGLNYVN